MLYPAELRDLRDGRDGRLPCEAGAPTRALPVIRSICPFDQTNAVIIHNARSQVNKRILRSPARAVDTPSGGTYVRAQASGGLAMDARTAVIPDLQGCAMKVRNSLKSLRSRHRDNRLVRRKGRLYVINKTQRRFKARQG